MSFCPVTASLARYERQVDRNAALEAAIEREEAAIYADVELLHDILSIKVADMERSQPSGRRGPGIDIIGFESPTAVKALADVFRILSEAKVAGQGDEAVASGGELIELIDQAKDLVYGMIRAAAEERVEGDFHHAATWRSGGAA